MKNKVIHVILSTLLLYGEPTSAHLEKELRTYLDAINTDLGFTLTLIAENGHEFTHSVGNSNLDTLYKSASTSKWVTSTIIMWLVETNILSLNDTPQQYIATWPKKGNLAKITLKSLLSFTSGLYAASACTHVANSDFESCVSITAIDNMDSELPGTTFNYNAAHMQVAGLMAVKALNVATWQDVFKRFTKEFDLFSNSAYNIPSENNPVLAGGMTWTTRDYREFLKKLTDLEIVNSNTIAQMSASQTTQINISDSPWDYGLGLWIECFPSQVDCVPANRVSSPGSYGSYPFVDYDHQYFGILAMQGPSGTIEHIYPIFDGVKERIETWAGLNRR